MEFDIGKSEEICRYIPILNKTARQQLSGHVYGELRELFNLTKMLPKKVRKERSNIYHGRCIFSQVSFSSV
jgi:hypothetical protein